MSIKQLENYLDFLAAEMSWHWDKLVSIDESIMIVEKEIEALKILHLCKTGKLYDES